MSDLSAEELSCWNAEVIHSNDQGISPSMNNEVSSICRSQSARLKEHIDFEHESSIPPNLEPNAEVFSDWRTLGASEAIVAALSGQREMTLLQTYLRECADWFDVFDAQRHYARKNVIRMMSCPPWRAAALALAAKYLELNEGLKVTTDSLSLHLYQLAVQLAIDSINGRFDCVGTTAGCVTLALYEMMTITYRDWRRHLQGCLSIFSHNRWNGDSLGLIGAAFWNYARIDVWAAFCVRSETMLDTENWFHHLQKIVQSINLSEDHNAHVATWLLARVNNFIHSSESLQPLSTAGGYQQLKNDVQRWEKIGGSNTKATMKRHANHLMDQPLPKILFSSDSSAVASLLWRTTMVLLLDFEISNSASKSESVNMTIYQHACSAFGIVETNKISSSMLVNAVQPLWICGRHLRTKSEKFSALELLSLIERKTSWKTRWRSDSLREIWNLD